VTRDELIEKMATRVLERMRENGSACLFDDYVAQNRPLRIGVDGYIDLSDLMRDALKMIESAGFAIAPREADAEQIKSALAPYLRACTAAQGGAPAEDNIFAIIYRAMVEEGRVK
jgi:hypothetical protein